MPYQIGNTDERLFDARIDVEGSSVILHSRGGGKGGGAPRNPGYAEALEAICRRAVRNGAYLDRVLIDSVPARLLPQTERILLDSSEIEGRGAAELAKLIRARLRRHGQAVGTKGGNSTKQVRFDFNLPQHSLITSLRLRKVMSCGARSPLEGTVAVTQTMLTISDEATLVAEGFNTWRAALLEGARRDEDLWVQSSDRFVFRNQANRKSMELGPRTALGVDPTGSRWAVQINEANTPADRRVTSAIATDAAGRPYLLRQGRLNPPTSDEDPILYEDFKNLTGWEAASVSNGDTKIKRDWYVVTPLDVASSEIRANTAHFIDACVVARSGGEGAGCVGDLAILTELSAPDETGGTFEVGAQPARDPKIVRKWQGEVWTAMAKLLRSFDFEVDKPRPAGRYEVDAEIVRGKRRLLVEIKCGATAADVYTGVGQLLLYSKLLPRLSSHTAVLLLPTMPRPVLAKAVADCGVTLCTYQCREEGDVVTAKFSRSFLQVCGLRR